MQRHLRAELAADFVTQRKVAAEAFASLAGAQACLLEIRHRIYGIAY
jgi:hypothetical protein